jgi:hypothetical protein
VFPWTFQISGYTFLWIYVCHLETFI